MNVESRLRQLEIANKRMRFLLLCVGTIATLSWVCDGLVSFADAGAKVEVQNVVRAKSFQVVNDKGKLVVELGSLDGTADDDVGSITTFNSAGKPLIRLRHSIGKEGGQIVVYNGHGDASSNEKIVIKSFTAGDKSSGAISIAGPSGENVFEAGIHEGADFVEPVIALSDWTGNYLVVMKPDNHTIRGGYLCTFNANKQKMVELGRSILPNNEPYGGSVFTFSPNGTPLVGMASNPLGDGSVGTLSKTGKYVVVITGSAEGGVANFYNRNGTAKGSSDGR